MSDTRLVQAIKLLSECHELSHNWPDVAYGMDLDARVCKFLADNDPEHPAQAVAEVTDAQIDAALAAKVAGGDTVEFEIDGAHGCLGPESRKLLNREIIRAALAAALKGAP